MKKLRLILQLALLALAIFLPGAAMAQTINLTVNPGSSENSLTWTYDISLIPGGTWTILRSANGSTSESLAVLDFGTTNYIDTSATPGIAYDYQIAHAVGGSPDGQSSVMPGISLAANGVYVLVNSLSGLALSVSNNVAVQQNYTGGSNQHWTLVSLGGNAFALANQGAATLSGPTPSAQLTLAAFSFNSNQEWSFQNVTPGGSTPPIFLVNNLGTGQLLDDLNASTNSGSPVGQSAPNGAADQNWIMSQHPLPEIQGATVVNDDQLPQAYVSAQIGSAFPATVIVQFGTNTAYGQAVTNTFVGASGYQPVAVMFSYPSLNVTTTLHAFITVSNLAGIVTSGDFTCSSLLFENKYSSDFVPTTDPRYLAPSTGSATWLDFDNDGWLDIVHSGQDVFDHAVGYVIFNPSTNLISGGPWTHMPFASGSRVAVAVGDFDNDNRPDIFFAGAPYLAGETFNDGAMTGNFDISNCGIWYSTSIRNETLASLVNNASFTAYLHVQDASAVVADFDHTGRQDVMLSGNFLYTNFPSGGVVDGPGPFSLLLQNNLPDGRNMTTNIPSQGFFDQALLPVNTSIPYLGLDGLANISRGQALLAAGDFDNDGFLDLFALNFRIDSSVSAYAGFFHGDGNKGFKATSRFPLYPGLSGDQSSFVEVSSCVVADLNGDGYLDMVLSYVDSQNAQFAGITTAGIWLNDGHGNLTNSSIVIPQLQLANFAVGDIFNHGRNDILMVGCTSEGSFSDTLETVVLRNDGNGVFTPVVLGNFGCVGETGHGLQLADYDKDGRLDFVMTGDEMPSAGAGNLNAVFQAATHIFRNEMNIPSNAPPAAPPGLSTTVGDGTVTFHWGNATDDITPANLLTYNLRVGTNSLGTSVVSPIADVLTGWRKIVAPGNCGHITNTLYRFPPGTYYWSVQAVDGGFAGGAWAPEQTFTITNPEPATLAINNNAAANIPFNNGTSEFIQQQLVFLNGSTNVLNVTSNSLNLSWPTRFKGYTLEQATNLDGPWTANTPPTGTLDGQYSVLVTNSGPTTFYRLVK